MSIVSIVRRAVPALLVLALRWPRAAAASSRPGAGPPGGRLQRVVLAGGCFWGMEAVFGDLRGVVSAVPGYAGGSAATAHYDQVSTGTTGHAEAVAVTYDPAVLSYRRLLDVYFLVAHDPTELDRQGPDEGTQYRSEIFYTTADQHDEATRYIAQLTNRHAFDARELDPLSKVPLKLYGHELQAESFAVAKMNGIIHDMDIEMARGDSMINPKFRNADGSLRQFDIVVANPMWNQPLAQEIYENDAFDRFRSSGGMTSGKGDWAWLQHTLACMNECGRAAVVLDTGAVARGSGSKNEDRERNIRKWFVDFDLIDGVILLPDNLFYNTTAAGVIVMLNKSKAKERKDKIVLVNASRQFAKGRPKNYLV